MLIASCGLAASWFIDNIILLELNVFWFSLIIFSHIATIYAMYKAWKSLLIFCWIFSTLNMIPYLVNGIISIYLEYYLVGALWMFLCVLSIYQFLGVMHLIELLSAECEVEEGVVPPSICIEKAQMH